MWFGIERNKVGAGPQVPLPESGLADTFKTRSGSVETGVGLVVAVATSVALAVVGDRKQASKLVDVVKFLQKFIKGDILKFLRAVKFSQYEKALLQTLDSIISKLMSIVRSVRAKLMQLPSFSYTQELIRKLSEWERRFYSLLTGTRRR